MNPPPIRILRRPTHRVNPLNADNTQSPAPPKTLEQREADYAAARRRIMGSESEDLTTVSENSEVEESDTNLSESGSANKATTSDDQGSKIPTTPIKSSHTAIPLMSIPLAALSIPSSLDRSSQINPRPISIVQQTGSSHLSTCVASTTCQLPAFVSNMSSLHHQSPNALSSDSLLSGYSSVPYSSIHTFNSNVVPQSPQNTVVEVIQKQPSHHQNGLKTGVPVNMADHYHLLRQYQQTLAANQVNMQSHSHPVTVQPDYQSACQRAAYNQLQNLMPSMQFQQVPPRFTYSSGYN